MTNLIGVVDNAQPVINVQIAQSGPPGDPGKVWLPEVDEESVLSWTLDDGETQPEPVNIKGKQGEKGDKPAHTWDGTELQFENPDGTPGAKVDLKGKEGEPGKVGDPGDVWKPTVSEGGDLSWTKDSGDTPPLLQNIKGGKGDTGDTWKPAVNQDGDLTWSKAAGDPAPANIKGKQGDAGDVWKPSVSEDGDLSWTKDSGATAPTQRNIKGQPGATGPAPEHQWVDTTKLQFKQPDGSWGTATQLKGQPGGKGDDGKGWTGGSYDDQTGKVTFTSTDELGFVTGDLRGSDGDPGPGVASGGSDGQLLAKDGLTDYATKWVDAPSGGGAQVWTTTTAPTTSGGNNTFTIANLTGLPNTEPKVGDIVFYQFGGYRVNTVGETTVQTASTQAVGLPSYGPDQGGSVLTIGQLGGFWSPTAIVNTEEVSFTFDNFVNNFILPVAQYYQVLPEVGCLQYEQTAEYDGGGYYSLPVIVTYHVNQDNYNGVRGTIYNHPTLGSCHYEEYLGNFTYTPLSGLIEAKGVILEDDGNYFTATDTEGALQELASEFQAFTSSLGDGIYLIKPSYGERWFSYDAPLNEIIARINAGTMPDKGLAKYHYLNDADPDNEYGSTRYFTYEKSGNRLSGVRLDTYLSEFRSYKYDKDAGDPWTFYPLSISTKASGASIDDAGSHFTATHVEGALQEIGALLDGLETALEDL